MSVSVELISMVLDLNFMPLSVRTAGILIGLLGNPAFLGFDLMYAGILLLYFNWLLLAFTLWAAVSLHLQVLQEEKYLPTVFGEEYLKYKENTCRYLGRRGLAKRRKE